MDYVWPIREIKEDPTHVLRVEFDFDSWASGRSVDPCPPYNTCKREELLTLASKAAWEVYDPTEQELAVEAELKRFTGV